MTLKYDFDIFDLTPGEAGQDPELTGFMTKSGLSADAQTDKVALFRDEMTAQALRDAAPQLRDFFIASGFGLNTYASGAPENRYPAADEDARLDLIGRLAANAENFALPKPADYPEGGNVFRLGEFLVHLAEAQPVMELAPLVLHDQVSGEITPKAKTTPTFDTADSHLADAKPPKKRFWQLRMFQVVAGLTAVTGVLQIVAGHGLMALAGS